MTNMSNGICDADFPDLIDDDDNDQDWSDGEEDEPVLTEQQQVKCIFLDTLYPTAKDYFLHLKQKYEFDIWNLVHVDLNLDFFGYVKLINFLRSTFKGLPPPSSVELGNMKHVWDDEKYLKPVISDDLLLQFMIDDEEDGDQIEDLSFNVASGDSVNNANRDLSNDHDGISSSKNSSFYKTKSQNLEFELKEANAKIDKMKDFMKDVILTNDIYRPVAACRRQHDDLDEEEFEDSGYFGTYSHHDIHAEMLQDKVRTLTYQNAILQNSHAFENKTILDVGCGTGILSMFAVKAGAKHVYAVDMSDIAYQAMDIIKENKMENKITVIKGCIEDIDLPVDNIDIIVSEWMGYFLFYESMLDSVLFAAEKWLTKEGLLLPDECSISLLGAHDENLLKSQVQFWDDVYGFRMSCMKTAAMKEAFVQIVPSQSIMSEAITVAAYDIHQVKAKQLNFQSNFQIAFTKSGICSALVAYFDIGFKKGLNNPVSFSTSPFVTPTHWKQTVFFLEKSISVKSGDIKSGFIDCHKNPHDPRSLIVNLSFDGMKRCYTVC